MTVARLCRSTNVPLTRPVDLKKSGQGSMTCTGTELLTDDDVCLLYVGQLLRARISSTAGAYISAESSCGGVLNNTNQIRERKCMSGDSPANGTADGKLCFTETACTALAGCLLCLEQSRDDAVQSLKENVRPAGQLWSLESALRVSRVSSTF
jgi:hypothetical protein